MYNIMLASSVLHSDLTIAYIMKWSQSYYHITDYILYAVYYTPVASLFYNWGLYLLISFTYFAPASILLLSGNYPFAFCIYESVFVFCLLVCFVF